MWLFAIFVLLPLIEISLFITIGGWLTLWPTLAIVLGTAMLGTWLIRRQGAMTMLELRRALSEMRDPSRPLADGAMILLAGALLVTPGFLTDTIGLLLLVPAVRHRVFGLLRRHFRIRTVVGGRDWPGEAEPPHRRDGDTIDGEYEEVDRTHRHRDGPSGWTRH